MSAGDNVAHVRLMTLLNVKNVHPREEDRQKAAERAHVYPKQGASSLSKRKRDAAPVSVPAEKHTKAEQGTASHASELHQQRMIPVIVAHEEEDDDDGDENHGPSRLKSQDNSNENASIQVSDQQDAFHWHFDAESKALQGIDPEHLVWGQPEPVPQFGGAQLVRIHRETSSQVPHSRPVSRPHARIWRAFSGKTEPTALQIEFLQYLGEYMDVWHSRVTIPEHAPLRQVTAMHAMSHLAKTRQRILKDNERLAKAVAAQVENDKADQDSVGDDELPEFRDQGFTRPKVLVLAPFRHTAKAWIESMIACSGCEQVEQKARFEREFSLPPGSIDKLADPESAHRYPEDHRHTFQGNIDDNFKLGVKLTRKTLRLYSAFYESDLIMTSPLGLRLLIEKDHDSDYLSSLEIVIADQLDVMLMQNWEHVKFVWERLSVIPKEAHDTDFSRVKPWYLDGQAPLLRQSILFSSLDAPEFRHLFHSLQNVGGRLRTTSLDEHHVPSMSLVTPGVRQTFFRFECSSAQSEADLRLLAFKDRIMSLLKKSAVTTSHTMIVVPSFFDFVRVEDYFRKLDPPISYTTLSEYSSTRDISRAREAFFSGKKSVLLLSERFHYYRRYIVRGAMTVIFYAPPEHATFYAELTNAPLTSRYETQAVVDAGDLQVWTLFCKYDLLRLERIAGAQQARHMLTGMNTSYHFV